MFESSSSNVRHRNKIRVTFHLMEEEPFDASVFLAVNERLLDLLNDSRAYLPVERDGQTVILAKAQIITVVEAARPQDDFSDTTQSGPTPNAQTATNLDHYGRLKVSRTATAEEVKAAYRARAKLVHPDSLAAQGFDPEFIHAASGVMQKLNEAYETVMSEGGRTTVG